MPRLAMWFTEKLISIESQPSEERGDRRALVSCHVLLCIEYPLMHPFRLPPYSYMPPQGQSKCSARCIALPPRRGCVCGRSSMEDPMEGFARPRYPETAMRQRGREDLRNGEDERRWPPPDWTAHSPISQQRPQGS